MKKIYRCHGAFFSVPESGRRKAAAESRFAKPRKTFQRKVSKAAERQKDLSLLVGSYCLGALIRGLENLESPVRERFYSFRLYEKNQKYPKGLRPSGLPGTIQSSAGSNFSENSGGSCRNRFCPQNGGEKALNRCDVPALQRKDLERTSKGQPYSLRTVGYGWVEICGVGCGNWRRLRTVGYGWVRICGVGCGNWRRLRTVKQLVRIGGVLVAKKACFFSL